MMVILSFHFWTFHFPINIILVYFVELHGRDNNSLGSVWLVKGPINSSVKIMRIPHHYQILLLRKKHQIVHSQVIFLLKGLDRNWVWIFLTKIHWHNLKNLRYKWVQNLNFVVKLKNFGKYQITKLKNYKDSLIMSLEVLENYLSFTYFHERKEILI